MCIECTIRKKYQKIPSYPITAVIETIDIIVKKNNIKANLQSKMRKKAE